MGWFPGSLIRQTPSAPPPVGHRSLALKILLDSLRPESRYMVLDLGPPVGSNIEFLSALSCRVRIVDLHRSLSAEPVESREPSGFESLLDRLLPLRPNESFDVVFAWDLFDYLRRDQIASVMARVSPACRSGALIFTLVWTRPRIPAVPLRYVIVNREYVSYTGSFEPGRPGRRYLQPHLARTMPGFVVKNSFLLRHGIQEYLFTNAAAGATSA